MASQTYSFFFLLVVLFHLSAIAVSQENQVNDHEEPHGAGAPLPSTSLLNPEPEPLLQEPLQVSSMAVQEQFQEVQGSGGPSPLPPISLLNPDLEPLLQEPLQVSSMAAQEPLLLNPEPEPLLQPNQEPLQQPNQEPHQGQVPPLPQPQTLQAQASEIFLSWLYHLFYSHPTFFLVLLALFLHNFTHFQTPTQPPMKPLRDSTDAQIIALPFALFLLAFLWVFMFILRQLGFLGSR